MFSHGSPLLRRRSLRFFVLPRKRLFSSADWSRSVEPTRTLLHRHASVSRAADYAGTTAHGCYLYPTVTPPLSRSVSSKRASQPPTFHGVDCPLPPCPVSARFPSSLLGGLTVSQHPLSWTTTVTHAGRGRRRAPRENRHEKRDCESRFEFPSRERELPRAVSNDTPPRRHQRARSMLRSGLASACVVRHGVDQ